MKKILSILVCVCVLLSAMVMTVSAAETSATISFADKANRTEFDSNHQVWVQNGITVTNNKAASSTAVGDYNGRFYKDSQTIITYPNMTKIVIDTTGVDSKYRAWDTSFTDSNATATATASATTITFATPVDSFTFAKMSAQCRANSITVYAEAAGGNEGGSTGGETPDPEPTPEPTPEPFDPAGKTAAEIVDAAYALESGKAFEKNATLTGEIINIDSPYSSQYKNIDVTIKVDGADANKPIKCYRLKGEGADTLAVGDKITVTGTIKNYNGTIEFDQGCTLDALVKGEGETPVAPENPKEIVDAAFALEAGKTLPYAATLTGKITNIEKINEQYGDVCLTIAVEGTDGEKELYCYNLKPTEGIDVNTLVVGDKITVTGNIKNYNGTIEFISCSFVMATDDGEGDGEGEGTTPPAGEGEDTGTGSTTGGSTSGTTTGGTTGGSTTGSTTTTTPEVKPNTDNSTTSPATGDSMGAVAMMAIAAAAVLVASKKR